MNFPEGGFIGSKDRRIFLITNRSGNRAGYHTTISIMEKSFFDKFNGVFRGLFEDSGYRSFVWDKCASMPKQCIKLFGVPGMDEASAL